MPPRGGKREAMKKSDRKTMKSFGLYAPDAAKVHAHPHILALAKKLESEFYSGHPDRTRCWRLANYRFNERQVQLLRLIADLGDAHREAIDIDQSRDAYRVEQAKLREEFLAGDIVYRKGDEFSFTPQKRVVRRSQYGFELFPVLRADRSFSGMCRALSADGW